ncbi:MAG: hypothetical protein K0Q49_1956 [Haloplasmataceae bacterium]|jgi:RimJ/RimL family protein N-acetyltransferase|nr:hypothetical protein [Haloplasmataceae bacterium]
MKIEFVPINYANLNDCTILAKWFNDPELNYLISPNFYPGELPYVSAEYISQSNIHPKNEKFAYFIVADNNVIGDVNIIANPEYLTKFDGFSSWLGITIGEKEYHGYGIGKQAMNFIEEVARDLGFTRMELGVFSFNKRAIEFYKKLGYKHITKVPNFTYYEGSWYDDLRFEKYL